MLKGTYMEWAFSVGRWRVVSLVTTVARLLKYYSLRNFKVAANASSLPAQPDEVFDDT